MEFDNNIPIYIQVINDIKKNIVMGRLRLGEKMPSGRDLALEYQINPNTANRIYKELEIEGLCFTKRGLGTFVTEDERKLKEIQEDLARELIQKFILGMKDLDYSLEEIIEIIQANY